MSRKVYVIALDGKVDSVWWTEKDSNDEMRRIRDSIGPGWREISERREYVLKIKPERTIVLKLYPRKVR